MTIRRGSSITRRLAAGAALGLALALAGCDSRATDAPAAPPPEVGIGEVMVHSIREQDEYNGRIASVEAVDVRPRVSGYIDRVAFRDGDDLRAGDLMFVIDQRPYKAALESAEAQLQRSHAAARFAKMQLERAQSLIGTQAIARQELDNRQTTQLQAEADVRAAAAAVVTARLNLTYSEVRAPIAGRAGRALLTAGNLAQADQSALASLVSLDPIYVYFNLDEHSYLRYLAHWSGKRREDRAAVRIALANETGFPHAGRVDFLDNRLDPATGTFRVRAALANPDKTLTPGLYARVQVEAGAPFTAMLIDDRAVLTDQDRKYVYVVDGNKAHRKDVEIGRTMDGLRVVRSGLDPNDRVVVVGTQKIQSPGMRVTPRPLKPEPAHTATAG